MIFNGSGVCEAERNVKARMLAAHFGKKHGVPPAPLIAIIDDDQSMLHALVGLVRSAGYDVRGFASAEDFLGCGAVAGFACIISDVQMPGMSGIELMRHLVASRYATPLIMITARHDPGLEERALASGAVCFLRKPVVADTLINCLEKALKT